MSTRPAADPRVAARCSRSGCIAHPAGGRDGRELTQYRSRDGRGGLQRGTCGAHPPPVCGSVTSASTSSAAKVSGIDATAVSRAGSRSGRAISRRVPGRPPPRARREEAPRLADEAHTAAAPRLSARHPRIPRNRAGADPESASSATAAWSAPPFDDVFPRHLRRERERSVREQRVTRTPRR